MWQETVARTRGMKISYHTKSCGICPYHLLHHGFCHMVCLCVPLDSDDKQRLLPRTPTAFLVMSNILSCTEKPQNG